MGIKIAHTIIRIVMFVISFMILSGINFDKFLLPNKNKAIKAQGLLVLLSLALGYLSSEFIITLLTTFKN